MRTLLLLTLTLALPAAAFDEVPDYSKDVAPILSKYCVGCHAADDQEGELSLETWADLQKGGEHGKVVLAAGPESSTLIRRITGEDTPVMPPEDNEAPTPDEVKILRAWVAAGAKGPNGAEPGRRLVTPHIAPTGAVRKPITALDWSPNGKTVASGLFGEIIVSDSNQLVPQWRVAGLAGKVNSVRFSKDGTWLAVATGVTGVSGSAAIYDAARGTLISKFNAHKDTLFTAVLSPDKSMLATAGYDRRIILWDTKTRKQIRTLEGHNGAIFDLDFAPDGKTLASASADETIKVWNAETGERLDTRGEPLDEQYVVRFSPDGNLLLGGGADNRIRIWKFVSRAKRANNPLLFARFGHEGPVTHMRFSVSGDQLVSAAEDKTVKLWETTTFTPVHAFEQQPATVASLAIAPGGDHMVVGRMDGSLGSYDVKLPRPPFVAEQAPRLMAARVPTSVAAFKNLKEAEPNNGPQQAQAITVPATITGVIHAADASTDEDMFRFAARKGERWVIETKAARKKSPLDSHVSVLAPDGKPVPRVLLRAVRDSYFTFRGKNSDTSDDFRIHNWEEMELNQYIYSNGEVARLWLYPRGPDSGFKVYPGRGKRYGFFDTTPLSHALHEPCYIVEPHPPGTEFVPNGLPTFAVNYENDDDAKRRLGKDSKLFFTAPKDGQYIIRVKDTRGHAGADFKYELIVRPPAPGFKAKLAGANPTVNAGSGREFNITVDRVDGFDGPVRIDITGMPPGYHVTSPIIVEAGQNIAFGNITAEPNAPAPSDKDAKASVVTATAFVEGTKVESPVNNFGTIKHAAKPKLLVTLKPNSDGQEWSPNRPYELTIAPGETITARVIVERNGFKGRVDFGKDDSGRNLPHGVYIDNIGLNGLMIVEGQTERDFFITAAKWVPETTRLFHLRATAEKGQTSWPILLHVRRKEARITSIEE